MIEIPLRPKAAPRPRSTKFGHTYMPSDYQDYKKQFALLAKSKVKYSEEALRLDMIFQFKMPKSWNKKKKLNPPYHIGKPDKDNLSKTVMDALNGIAYKDDSQICEGFQKKQYGEIDAVFFEITELLKQQ